MPAGPSPSLVDQPYALLFGLVALEGPAATVAAGALASAGVLLWPLALLVVVSADLAADSAYYLAGRLGHRPGPRRLLRRLGLDDERAHRFGHVLSARLGPTVVGAKVLDAAAVPVLVAAGLARVGYARLLAWNLLATLPRAAVLLLLGAVAGPQVTALLDRFDVHPLAVLLAAPAFAVAGLALARRWPPARRPRAAARCARGAAGSAQPPPAPDPPSLPARHPPARHQPSPEGAQQ